MEMRYLTLFFILLSLPNVIGAREANAGPGVDLFGAQETRSANLRPFPKWTKMLERYFRDAGTRAGPCSSKIYNKCHAQRWQALVDQQKGRDFLSQLHAVNAYMNKAHYIVDPINWGVRDYWATPGQFFAKFGDCEDYAIAKYLTLKRLGIDPKRMRIVVVQDMNLRVAHAILAIYTGDGIIILDNQIKSTVQANVIRHYRPIFSINEEAWWLHRPMASKRRRKRS
jgi:predicted transglutaminase-like cysteine proteinase